MKGEIVRKLVLITLGLYLAISTSVMAFKAANREQYPVSVKQVVRVGYGCTGFIADYNFVVTARHCVESGDAVEKVVPIQFYDGVFSQFNVVAYGQDTENNDFAVLIGDTRGIMPFIITKRLPSVGEICLHVGYGGASAQQLMIPCEAQGTEGGYVKIGSNAIPGDSGSAVILYESMEVFGILVRSAYPIPVTYAVPAYKALKAINKIKKGK